MFLNMKVLVVQQSSPVLFYARLKCNRQIQGSKLFLNLDHTDRWNSDAVLFIITAMRQETKYNNCWKLMLCKAGVLCTDAEIFLRLYCINGRWLNEYGALMECQWWENGMNLKNLSHFHSIHHKSHRDWPGIVPRPPKQEDNNYAPHTWQGLSKAAWHEIRVYLAPVSSYLLIQVSASHGFLPSQSPN